MSSRAEITTKQFIEKAKATHGNKYDYSKTEYINMRTKVKIVCKEHGEFTQIAYSHTGGRGCQKCARRGTRLTTEEFIERSKLIHGNKYDYSNVCYKNNYTKVKIACSTHGDFLQTPQSHLEGRGCQICGFKTYAHDRESYVHKAKQVHENKYNYSKTFYEHSHKKLIITCPFHGDFEQLAYQHLLGRGCPECGKNLVSEPIMREVLENLFFQKLNKHYKFPNVRPEWLKNYETGRSLELDCYNEELGIAFELQGTQHYEPVDFFGGDKTFARRIRHDTRKKQECINNNVYLICVDNRPTMHMNPKSKQKYYRDQIIKELKALPESFKKRLIEAKNNNK